MLWGVVYRTAMSRELGGGSGVRRVAQLRGALLGAKLAVRKCSSKNAGWTFDAVAFRQEVLFVGKLTDPLNHK